MVMLRWHGQRSSLYPVVNPYGIACHDFGVAWLDHRLASPRRYRRQKRRRDCLEREQEPDGWEYGIDISCRPTWTSGVGAGSCRHVARLGMTRARAPLAAAERQAQHTGARCKPMKNAAAPACALRMPVVVYMRASQSHSRHQPPSRQRAMIFCQEPATATKISIENPRPRKR